MKPPRALAEYRDQVLSQKHQIKRRRRAKGEMSDEEKRFIADYLEPRRLAKESTGYAYEPKPFPLGRKRTYTLDFREDLPDGTIVYYEVKGTTRTKKLRKPKPWMEADASVKLAWLVTLYPELDVRVAFRDKAEWIIRKWD